jgi:hypothetical protein
MGSVKAMQLRCSVAEAVEIVPAYTTTFTVGSGTTVAVIGQP